MPTPRKYRFVFDVFQNIETGRQIYRILDTHSLNVAGEEYWFLFKSFEYYMYCIIGDEMDKDNWNYASGERSPLFITDEQFKRLKPKLITFNTENAPINDMLFGVKYREDWFKHGKFSWNA